MTRILCIAFRFVQPFPVFHGRGDAGQPEWPPSPMRAFQALVNAAARRHPGSPSEAQVRSALTAIEAIRPRIIAAPARTAEVGFRSYVPHNQADLVTAAWHRGNGEASVASHRMEKDFRPTYVESDGDELPVVYYLYALELPADVCQRLLDSIRPVARSVTALGWGIDQAVADATLLSSAESAALVGQAWRPARQGGRSLRTPRSGTLRELEKRHRMYLRRIVSNEFAPVPPLTATERVPYRRDTDAPPRPYAVFKLLDENEDAFRYPHARLIHVAGMVRHAAIKKMVRNPPPFIKDPDWINCVVRGKQDESTTEPHRQFSYVPLPSIGHAHADAMIRNVIVIAPPGMARELNYLAEQINGQVLTPEGEADTRNALSTPSLARGIELQKFEPLPRKFIAECYLGTSNIWETVTPVILDGHDDKKPQKTTKLIRLALQRSGIETPCTFTWQAMPFLKNCLSAHKYDRDGRHTGYHRPAHLKNQTAIHVRLTFEHPVPGPLTIGAGRHCGFGLFAAVPENP